MPDHALWHNLIDYAGVFPPARLPLTEAIAEYRQASSDPEGWILGPCLVRASQISEIEQAPARLGAVLDVSPGDLDPLLPLAQVEARLDAIGSLDDDLWRDQVLYVESPNPAETDFLDEVARVRASGRDVRAKIRTGGAAASAFPAAEVVARFIDRCRRLDLPFKATAGLHHPYRHPSTVDDAVEHGFINILAAVRATLAGGTDQAATVLAATDPSEFDPVSATWRDVGRQIPDTEVRRLFRSFGSCSFAEPTGYLRELGVLPLEGAR